MDNNNNIDKIITSILEEPKTVALLIHNYFAKECNIELGEFTLRTYESEEPSALEYDKSICIDKYSFQLDNVHTCVHIRYIKDKNRIIDKDFIYIDHIEVSNYDSSDLLRHNMLNTNDNLQFIVHTVSYLVKNVRLKIDLDMKFEKVED